MHNVVATLLFDDNLPAAPIYPSLSLFLSSPSFLFLCLHSFIHPYIYLSLSSTSIHPVFSLRLVRRRVYESIYVKEKERR